MEGFLFPSAALSAAQSRRRQHRGRGGGGHPRTPKAQTQLQSLPGSGPARQVPDQTRRRWNLHPQDVNHYVSFSKILGKKKKSPNAMDSWAIVPFGPGAEAAAAPAPGPCPPRGPGLKRNHPETATAAPVRPHLCPPPASQRDPRQPPPDPAGRPPRLEPGPRTHGAELGWGQRWAGSSARGRYAKQGGAGRDAGAGPALGAAGQAPGRGQPRAGGARGEDGART